MPGRARQAAVRRPAAVAVHDDSDMQGSMILAHGLMSPRTLCCKVSWQIFGSGRPQAAWARCRAGRLPRSLGGAGGIAHHLLQHLEIFEIALASLRGDPADGLRPVAIVALLDGNQAGFLEHLQMAGEIAVGEAAHLLERAEDEALRMRRERGEHGEPRLLVNDAVETFIGEAAGLLTGCASFRHGFFRCDTGWRPS